MRENEKRMNAWLQKKREKHRIKKERKDMKGKGKETQRRRGRETP